MTDSDLQAQIAALRVSFAHSIPERLQELTDSLQSLSEITTDNTSEELDTALHLINRCAHKLNGTAATFGFPEIGAAASDMEDYVVELQKVAEYPTESMLEKLAEHSNNIRTIAAADPDVTL